MSKDDVTRARDVNEAIHYAIPTILAQLNPELRHNERNIAGLCLTGPPGVGKTAAFVSEMSKMGFKTLTLPCGTVDEVLTFQGLPEVLNDQKEYGAAEVKERIVDEEISKLTGQTVYKEKNRIITVGSEKTKESSLTTAWAPPEWITTLRNIKDDEKCILIFDDFHFIKGASIMELLTNNREVNGHVLGKRDNIALVFIGNGLEDAAGAQEMLAPVLDRMISISVEGVNADKWLDWAIEEGNIHELVVSYIQANKDELFKRGVGVEDPTDRRPGPRGWANFSDILNAADQMDTREMAKKTLPGATDAQLERLIEAGREAKERCFADLGLLLRGCVGKEAANKFAAWYRTFQQYPFEEYLKNPNKKIEIDESQLSSVSLNFSFRFSKILFEYKKYLVDSAARSVANHLNAHPEATRSSGVQSDGEKKTAVPSRLFDIKDKVESNELETLTTDERRMLSALTTVQESAKRTTENTKVYGEYISQKQHYGILPSPGYALVDSDDIDTFLEELRERAEKGEKIDPDKARENLLKIVDTVLGQYKKVEIPYELRKISGAHNLAEFMQKMISFAVRFSQVVIESVEGAQRHRALSTFLGRTTASFNAKDRRFCGYAPGAETGSYKSESDMMIKNIVGEFLASVYDLGSFAKIKTASTGMEEAEDANNLDAPKKRGRRPKGM